MPAFTWGESWFLPSSFNPYFDHLPNHLSPFLFEEDVCRKGHSRYPPESGGAAVIGINVPRIITVVFGIAIGLAGVAGVFYVLLFTIGPFIGLPLTIRYIAIVMLEGQEVYWVLW